MSFNVRDYIQDRMAPVIPAGKSLSIVLGNTGGGVFNESIKTWHPFGLNLRLDGLSELNVGVELDPDGILNIGSFSFSGDFKGKGFSKLALGVIHDLATLSPQGLKKITLTATNENGVSYWSSLGFFPTFKENMGGWLNISKFLSRQLEEHAGDFLPSDYARLHDIVHSDDPRAICAFSTTDIRSIGGVPAQSLLHFKGNNQQFFYGALDVIDPHYQGIFVPKLGIYITKQANTPPVAHGSYYSEPSLFP